MLVAMSKQITLLFLLLSVIGISSVYARPNNASRFSIFGEVHKPGIYSIEEQPSLLKLLTLAGGPSERAGKSVVIIREGGKDSNYQLITINLTDILKGQDTLLELGDAVYIPAAYNIYVTGEVNAPGSFRFQIGMTLRRILSLAQGVKSKTQLSVVIYREDNATGKREKIKSDISSILSGKVEDILLKPNDLVVVNVVKQIIPRK
jgi:polysaccharide export outer membrane protein